MLPLLLKTEPESHIPITSSLTCELLPVMWYQALEPGYKIIWLSCTSNISSYILLIPPLKPK
jgi:hypothetical protein